MSKHYFSFFFAELKGPSGSAGEARIQNACACYIALSLHFHLAKLAGEADPESFKPPSETMRRVYGLQTGLGGGSWRLVVAVAEPRERFWEGGEDSVNPERHVVPTSGLAEERGYAAFQSVVSDRLI